MGIFNIETRLEGRFFFLGKETPEMRTRAGGSREMGITESKTTKKRPLEVKARGAGWRWGEHKIRDAGFGAEAAVTLPCPRLLHFPGAVLAPGRPSAGRGRSPGEGEALPPNLQCKEQQPRPPQLPPSVSAQGESSLPLLLQKTRLDVAKPPANGAPGTREGLFSGGSWTRSPAERRPGLGGELGPEAAQAGTRLAGTSGSGSS